MYSLKSSSIPILEITSMICTKIEINLKYSCNKIISLHPCTTSRNLYLLESIVNINVALHDDRIVIENAIPDRN